MLVKPATTTWKMKKQRKALLEIVYFSTKYLIILFLSRARDSRKKISPALLLTFHSTLPASPPRESVVLVVSVLPSSLEIPIIYGSVIPQNIHATLHPLERQNFY